MKLTHNLYRLLTKHRNLRRKRGTPPRGPSSPKARRSERKLRPYISSLAPIDRGLTNSKMQGMRMQYKGWWDMERIGGLLRNRVSEAKEIGNEVESGHNAEEEDGWLSSFNQY